ncbi:hypothetical protein ACWGRJ_10385 [Bradyrhizobium sp. Lot11]
MIVKGSDIGATARGTTLAASKMPINMASVSLPAVGLTGTATSSA